MDFHVEEVSFFNANCIKPPRGSNMEVQRGGNVISKTIHVVTTLLPRGFVCRDSDGLHKKNIENFRMWSATYLKYKIFEKNPASDYCGRGILYITYLHYFQWNGSSSQEVSQATCRKNCTKTQRRLQPCNESHEK